MASRTRGFNQRRPRRAERKRLLVVTEGVKTEIQYFEGMVQFFRSTGVAVKGVRSKGVGKDPERVLQAALDFNEQDPDGFDEIWIVVDVDDHATLDAALVRARRLNIPVVVSNPCFEIWLIWHYEDCAAYQCTKDAVDRLGKFGHTEKQIPNTFPYDAHPDAVRRAKGGVALTEQGPNPSSAMPHLLAALQRRS